MGRIAIAAVVLALQPGAAVADRIGLVVRGPTVAPATGAQLLGALGRAGARAGHDVVRGPFAVARDGIAAGAVRSRRLASFARARRLLDEGVRAYSAAELAFAAGRLANARRVALEVADLPGGRELVADISLYLGVVRLELGQERGVQDLRLASRLDSERQVTVAEFKPDLVASYKRAAAELDERLTLEIESGTPGARIEVLGAGQAARDTWSGQVEPRLHVVTVTAPGHRPQSRLVPVRINERIAIELEADPGRQVIARGRESLAIPTTPRDATVAVEALATFAELDAVVIASSVWRRDQPALIAELCQGGPVRCQRAVEVRYGEGGLDAAARELWSRIGKSGGELPPGVLIDARVVQPDSAPGNGERDTSRHWARNPYVWLGVGAGMAVAIATTIVLVQDDGLQPEIIVGDDFLSP